MLRQVNPGNNQETKIKYNNKTCLPTVIFPVHADFIKKSAEIFSAYKIFSRQVSHYNKTILLFLDKQSFYE